MNVNVPVPVPDNRKASLRARAHVPPHSPRVL
jgi:hypothetical protein